MRFLIKKDTESKITACSKLYIDVDIYKHMCKQVKNNSLCLFRM